MVLMPLSHFDAFIPLINTVLLADVETSFSYHMFWVRANPFPQMPVYPCKYITIPKNTIINDIQITHSKLIYQNFSMRLFKQE